MGGGGVNPAMGAGFDGPSLPLPAPKVPQGQGSPPRLRGPRTKATWPGELYEPPRTLPNTPVRGQGGRLIGRRPNADQARERDRTARWRALVGGGEATFAEGLCLQPPNPYGCHVSVGSLLSGSQPARAPPYGQPAPGGQEFI